MSQPAIYVTSNHFVALMKPLGAIKGWFVSLTLDSATLHRGYLLHVLHRGNTCKADYLHVKPAPTRGCRRYAPVPIFQRLSRRVASPTMLPKLPPRLFGSGSFCCCASCLACYFEFSAAFFKPAKPLSNTPVIKLTAVSSS